MSGKTNKLMVTLLTLTLTLQGNSGLETTADSLIDDQTTTFIQIDGTPSSDISEINPTSVIKDTTADVSTETATDNTTNEELIDPSEENEIEESKEESSSLFKNRFKVQRKSAIDSLKERLKKRYEKARLQEDAPVSTRRSFTAASNRNEITSEKSDSTEKPRSSFRSRVTRPRSRSRAANSRSLEVKEEDDAETIEVEATSREEFGRSSKDFGRRRSTFRTKNRDADYRSSNKGVTSSRLTSPKLSFKTRGSSRLNTRTNSRPKTSQNSGEQESEDQTFRTTSFKKPSRSSTTRVGSSAEEEDIAPPPVVFKKFNRFDRPDLRKNLFNKYLKGRPGLKKPGDKTEENQEEDQEEDQLEDLEDEDQNIQDDTAETDEELFDIENNLNEEDPYEDHEFSPSALVSSVISDEDLLQQIDNEEIQLERLQTTLDVATVYPDKPKDDILEVATIRSPYTFDLENQEKSTRFITVTRTFTKSEEQERTLEISSISKTIKPTKSFSSGKKTPLFDTKSIPAPENILATKTPYNNDFKLSGSFTVETLPAVTLQSNLLTTPPFKTVTESFSTKEYMVKESILPVIQGSETSLYTLSQTYTVTRHVTAVKTIPPMDFYEFSPSNNFADFDALFEGAGTENRETLLPGELEFSDQDNFGLSGPSPVRVSPPPGFVQDLDLLAGKLDFVESMEKKHNPEIFELKQEQPDIQSSFTPFENVSPVTVEPTPSFQLPSISPEQLLYLQLLQNPLAALGFSSPGANQPKVVTESTPVFRTSTVYDTSTLRLRQGSKEFTTVITKPLGITTLTDYTYSTKTVSPGGGLSGFTDINPLANFGLQNQNINPLANIGGLLQPSFTVISSPVIRDTVQTITSTNELKIFFGNVASLTTITSTSLVSTQVTSYITKTQRVTPTANPFAGLLG